MSGQVELKSCPFCGGDAEIVSFQKINRTIYYAQCTNDDCEVNPETFCRGTKEEAAEAWNTRKGESNG